MEFLIISVLTISLILSSLAILYWHDKAVDASGQVALSDKRLADTTKVYDNNYADMESKLIKKIGILEGQVSMTDIEIRRLKGCINQNELQVANARQLGQSWERAQDEIARYRQQSNRLEQGERVRRQLCVFFKIGDNSEWDSIVQRLRSLQRIAGELFRLTNSKTVDENFVAKEGAEEPGVPA